MPFFAIRSVNKSKQYTKYSSLYYDVYKCYSGKVYAVGKRYEPICDRVVKYDEYGYYVNAKGLKISKKDYQSIYNVSHNADEIDDFSSNDEVNSALLVSGEYEKNLYKVLNTIKVGKEIYNAVVFKDLVVNTYGDYSWEYMYNDKSYYKCEKNGMFKEYLDGSCVGESKSLSYSSSWCELGGSSNNIDIKNTFNKFCN